MSKKRIVRYTDKTLPGIDRTDWGRLDATTDEDIDRAIAEDPDAAPLMPDSFFQNLQLLLPSHEGKTRITMMVDGDVLRFFRGAGPGYQGRMNAVLRAYMTSLQQRKKA